MKFKDLSIGQTFEFDRAGLALCHGMEPGPWEKVSPRCYTKYTDPFSSDEERRRNHGFWAGQRLQVGSINAAVIPAAIHEETRRLERLTWRKYFRRLTARLAHAAFTQYSIMGCPNIYIEGIPRDDNVPYEGSFAAVIGDGDGQVLVQEHIPRNLTIDQMRHWIDRRLRWVAVLPARLV